MQAGTALALTSAFAAILAATHLLAGRLAPARPLRSSSWTSLAGGLAAGYVFLHLLPELARGNAEVGDELADALETTALLEVAIFVVALFGFFVFYALRWAADRAITTGREPSSAIVAGHVAAFAAYNAVVVYTVPLKLRTDVSLALVFCAIIAMHLLQTDRLLAEQFPRRFAARRSGRLLLAAGAATGALAALGRFESTVLLTLLTAFLGGALLLNVLQEELPSRTDARLGWFAVGLAVSSIVLVGLAAGGHRGAA
jgi:hypothetical protein